MTRRLVDYYHPVPIYLFGSEARGDSGPDSDLDFMVVLPHDTPDEVMRSSGGYESLPYLGIPKDVIPWRKTDFEGACSVREGLTSGNSCPRRKAVV